MLAFKSKIIVIKSIYEILTAKNYKHSDSDIGLLKRVGGYWRVESPKKTLGVSVKIHGSDRFGPNRKSLTVYKLRKDQIRSIWAHAIKCIIEETRNDDGSPKFSENEFVLTEIIFGPENKDGAEFAYAFNVTSAPNEYGACFHDGKYKHYYTLY